MRISRPGLMVLSIGLLIGAGCRGLSHKSRPPSKAELQWNTYQEIQEQGDVNSAKQGYARLCESPVPYVRACFDHAKLVFETQSVAVARKEAAALILRYPNEGLTMPLAKRLAKSYIRAEEYAEGIAELTALSESALGTDVWDTLVYEVSKLSRLSGQVEAESSALEQLARKDRFESQLWDNAVWRLAEMARQSNDTSHEVVWLEKLVGADESSWLIGSYTTPFHDDALCRLGEIFLKQKELEKARAAYESLSKRKTSRNQGDGQLGLAKVLFKMGRTDQACQLLHHLIVTESKRGRVNEAETLYTENQCGGFDTVPSN